jgi:4-hydroxy-2-oxoheptanedioate aldolase
MPSADATPGPLNRLKALWQDDQAALGILLTALKSQVKLGGVARSPEQANRMIEREYRMLALRFDWSLLQRGAAAILEGIQR